jgi:hypothetical protein
MDANIIGEVMADGSQVVKMLSFLNRGGASRSCAGVMTVMSVKFSWAQSDMWLFQVHFQVSQ